MILEQNRMDQLSSSVAEFARNNPIKSQMALQFAASAPVGLLIWASSAPVATAIMGAAVASRISSKAFYKWLKNNP